MAVTNQLSSPQVTINYLKWIFFLMLLFQVSAVEQPQQLVSHTPSHHSSSTPKKSEKTQQELLGCGPEEFSCLDGSKCIPSRWFCDTSVDCLDGSDEPSSCPEPTCQEGQFSCKLSGKIVRKLLFYL